MRIPTNDERSIINNVLYNIDKYKFIEKEENLANPLEVKIKVEDDINAWGENVVAWTSFDKTIVIKPYIITNEDTFIYDVLAHELVHVNQYRTILGFILARTIYRSKSENKAVEIGQKVESWIKDIQHFSY